MKHELIVEKNKVIQITKLILAYEHLVLSFIL